MRTVLHLAIAMAACASAHAGIGEARRLMEQKMPAEAAKVIDEMLQDRPDDPWLLYNRATAAYAAGDFTKADEIWQRLAGWDLPEPLREKVWTQIGNVSFRLAEGAMAEKPDAAIARLEQSREAYRVVLSQNKGSEAAQGNLQFVERQLELHYVRLAERLVADAEKEPLADPAIEKLQGALEFQRNATALNPSEPRYKHAEGKIVRAIADRFTRRGMEAEKQADRIAEQSSLDQWNREAAQENYEDALADFREAQTFEEGKPEAKEGEGRVIDKLSGMFARAGREKQREADKNAKNDAPKAFEHYEQALAFYDQALAVKREHQDAAAGKKEVLDAMEQLHLREGDKMTKAGEKQIGKNAGEAAANLLGALDHFEQARAINPANPEIPPRIEHVQKLLPDVLVTIGQEEQKHAEAAEPKSVREAIAHLEHAEAGFGKALQIEEDNLPAKAGLEEVREDLARLRKQLAQEAEKQEQQQAQKKNKQEQPSFEAMLAQVKAKQQETDAKARKQSGTRHKQRNGNLRDW